MECNFWIGLICGIAATVFLLLLLAKFFIEDKNFNGK